MPETPSSPEAPPFEEVYRLYAGPVYRFCLSLAKNPAVAEDLGAATFTAAYAAYCKRPPDPDGVRPWLFRIARNLAFDHRRRESRRDRINQVVGRAESRVETVEQIAETNAELARSLTVMSMMKERERTLLALRAGGELSYREIGDLLGISERAATVATHRAIERFRRLSEEGT